MGISADPCRQQGERVRGGLTSNKGPKEKNGQARRRECQKRLEADKQEEEKKTEAARGSCWNLAAGRQLVFL